MRSPRKRTWFCSTSMVAPRRVVREAGLLELYHGIGQGSPPTLCDYSQDQRSHRCLSTSRRPHEEYLANGINSTISLQLETLAHLFLHCRSIELLVDFQQLDGVHKDNSESRLSGRRIADELS